MSTSLMPNEGYDDGPPPPDEIPSNKSKLPTNRVTPSKVKAATIVATLLADPVLSNQVTNNYTSCSDCTATHSTKLAASNAQSHSQENTQQEGKTSFVVSKIIRNKDKHSKKIDLTLKVNALIAYTKVSDDPRKQQIASELLGSDLLFLEIKEIEEDDVEPVYEIFGEGEPLCKDHADPFEGWKINNNCETCYADCCDEWRFGQYCVSAVKRYWNENSHCATIKDAYIIFVAHYNRVLDWHSYGEGYNHKLRPTRLTKPPYCMRKGSLLFSIQWIKWQIENGSEKELYDEIRKRRKLDELEKDRERELRKREFKPKKNKSYPYGGRKRKY